MNIGDAVQIAGCSTKNRLLETSSGCESFNNLCGGALVNTSLVFFDEPRSRHYANYLVKFFLAEGVHHKHDCVILGPDADASNALRKGIPSRKGDSLATGNVDTSVDPSDDLKIAWRYNKLVRVDPPAAARQDNPYDLTTPLENPDIMVLPPLSYAAAYERIYELVHLNELHTKGGERVSRKNLLRIVVQDVGSPLWPDADQMPRFLLMLRLLLRQSYAVAYLTTNTSVLFEKVARQVETFGDVFVELVAFSDREKKDMQHAGAVNGFFRVVSLPRLASVGVRVPPVLDLVFEAGRRGFDIRTLHLPPAGDENKPAPGCNVDF